MHPEQEIMMALSTGEWLYPEAIELWLNYGQLQANVAQAMAVLSKGAWAIWLTSQM